MFFREETEITKASFIESSGFELQSCKNEEKVIESKITLLFGWRNKVLNLAEINHK